MDCPVCHTPNAPHARHCEACGASLAVVPASSAPAPLQPVPDSAPVSAAAAPPVAPPEPAGAASPGLGGQSPPAAEAWEAADPVVAPSTLPPSQEPWPAPQAAPLLAPAMVLVWAHPGATPSAALLAGGRASIGREGAHDVLVPDPRASGVHAWVSFDAHGATLIDASRNGTAVDGRVLRGESAPLWAGSVVQVGAHRLLFLPVPELPAAAWEAP